MTCLPVHYGFTGRCENSVEWHNWLGNIRYVVPRYFAPATRQDLVSILQEAEAQGKKVKAVGTGWSYEDCAASEDWVVDIAELDDKITFLTDEATGASILTPAWQERQFRASAEKLYHVEAGITLYKLNSELEKEQRAMLTLGGSQGQTLAGAISTSTHGSSPDQPPLPGVVQAIHLVTTGGREVWIESASEPLTGDDDALRAQLGDDVEIIRDDSLLRAAKVTVGRFGVIYAYVIKVAPLYRLSEWTQELSWSAVSAALVGGVGRGSDVPVRGHLGDLAGLLADPPAGLEISTGVGDFHSLDILINPRLRAHHHGDRIWVRRRWLTDNPHDLNLSETHVPFCHRVGAGLLVDATITALGVYAGTISAIPVYGIIKANAIVADTIHLKTLALDLHLTGGKALAESLNAVWRAQLDHQLEWLVAHVNQMALGNDLGESTKGGRRGPGWQIMAGVKEDAVGDCYRSNSIELIFSTETIAYLSFVNQLLDDIEDFHTTGYIAIRFSSRSDACLSMHNVRSPLAVSVEVTSLYGLQDNDGWIAHAERTGKGMGGRPHWGQQNQMSIDDLSALYDPEEIRSWREQCLRVLGSFSPTFSNRYTRQRGLEPGQPTFGPWASVSEGRSTPGAPVTAVPWGEGIALFIADPAGGIYTVAGDPQAGFGPWASVSQGSSTPGAPVTAVPWGSRFALFLADPAGGIYTAGGDPQGGFGPWASVSEGRSTPGGPVTAVPWGQRFAVFLADPNGGIYATGGDPQGGFGPWASVSEGRTVPGGWITAVPWGGRFALFLADPSGGIYTAAGDPQGGFGPWASVSEGRTTPGAPVTAVPWGQRLALFIADPAGGIFTAAGDPQAGFGPWASVSQGSSTPGAPVIAVPWGNRFALFIADPAGGIFTAAGDPQGGFGPWASVSEGSSRPGAPVTAVPWGNRFAVFIADRAGGIFTAAGQP